MFGTSLKIVSIGCLLTPLGFVALRPAPMPLEEAMAGTVYVESGDGRCTGWVLKNTHEVVTAAHCAPGNGSKELTVDFGNGVGHKFHIYKIGDADLINGPDIMVLKPSSNNYAWPKGLQACKEPPKYGDILTLIGQPYGFRGTVTTGRVANPSTDVTRIMGADKDKVRFGKNYITFDGNTAPGNSGGPAIDLTRGCVVGMADLAYAREGNPSALHFLESAQSLEFLD